MQGVKILALNLSRGVNQVYVAMVICLIWFQHFLENLHKQIKSKLSSR